MMRIGLISDTHMPPWNVAMADQIAETFAGVDLILHAGDIISSAVLDWLETIAPVLAAKGNNDAHLYADARVRPLQTLTHMGVSVAVLHVYEPWNRDPHDMMRERYGMEQSPDVLVVGDTHFECIERRNGVLMVNPGSPTTPHLRTDLPGTVAILHLDATGAEAEIVTLGATGPS